MRDVRYDVCAPINAPIRKVALVCVAKLQLCPFQFSKGWFRYLYYFPIPIYNYRYDSYQKSSAVIAIIWKQLAIVATTTFCLKQEVVRLAQPFL